MKIKLSALALCASLFFVSSCSSDDDDDKNVAPATLQIKSTDITTDALEFEWTSENGSISYEVECVKTDEEFNNDNATLVDDGTSYRYQDLLAATEYKILVIGYNAADKKCCEGTCKFTTAKVSAEFIGTWEYYHNEEVVLSYTFNEDGTGVHLNKTVKTNFKWKADDKTLTIRQIDPNKYIPGKTYDYTKTEDCLKFNKTTFLRKK
ncbi:fibronectin type III domain-containing protein [Marinilabiliaceae bacterium JC017]|nr:fibronectin type III domain-containing protein [Marinilabiliaceae bacterium JC017]